MKPNNGAAPGVAGHAGWLAVCLVLALSLCGCTRSEDPAYYVAMLGHKNEDIQRRGIEELARMQKRALPALEEALDSPNPLMRKGAVNVLARIRHSEALLAVGRMIDDPDKDVRVAAIEGLSALAQVWKKRSVELLTEEFEQDDPVCVEKAALGLRDMRYDEATEVLRSKFQSGQGIQSLYAARLLYESERKPEMAQALLEGLASSDPTIRKAAEYNIETLKDLAVRFLVDTIVNRGTAAGMAMKVLVQVRDALIEELEETLDSKRADKILHALGTIADQESIDKLFADFADRRLETVWRVSAAEALGVAALSVRSNEIQKREIIQKLTETMDDKRVDNRVRIGAAIALCKLRQPAAVQYLLDELGKFQEVMADPAKVSPARLRDLTSLRIRAQEALTASGDFVVDFLMDKVRDPEAGPIIMWAAAKTLGELRVAEAVQPLGRCLTAKRPLTVARPAKGKLPERILVDAEGRLTDPQGKVLTDVALSDWNNPDEKEVADLQERMEEFLYPDYVRWTAALALGQIGGEEAVRLLKEGEAAEEDFIARLERNRQQKGFFRRAPAVLDLIRRHADVLFYIRKGLKAAGA